MSGRFGSTRPARSMFAWRAPLCVTRQYVAMQYVAMQYVAMPCIVVACASLMCGCGLTPEPLPADGCGPWSRVTEIGCQPRRWSPATELAPLVSQPVVAIGDDGEVVSAWLDEDQRLAVMVGGDLFSGPPGSALWPQIAVARSGGPVVVWEDHPPDGSSVIRHGYFQRQWQWPEPLSVGNTAVEPTISPASPGETLVTWVQWTGETWGVATASLHEGIVRTKPAHLYDVISPTQNFANYPVVAANEAGEAVVTWFQATNDRLMTFVSSRAVGSAFFSRPSPDEVVSPLGAPVDRPQIAIDAAGRVAAVWRQETGSGQQALYMATREGDRWQKAESLSDYFSLPVDVVYQAEVAFAATGDLFVVWQQDDDGDKGVFVAHRAADGTWIAPGDRPVRLSREGVSGFDPSLAAGGHGVVVTWTERDGDTFSVVARRSHVDLMGDEAMRWGTRAVLSSSDRAAASEVAMGGADRVACVWLDNGALWLAAID
jgi:hypothetical protein